MSGPADGPTPPRPRRPSIDDATHCPAYIQLLIKSLTAPGLEELADVAGAGAPGHLRDGPGRPASAVQQPLHHAPASRPTVSRLDGVGHIPMLEAPGRVTELIADFVDEHTAPRSEERRA